MLTHNRVLPIVFFVLRTLLRTLLRYCPEKKIIRGFLLIGVVFIFLCSGCTFFHANDVFWWLQEPELGTEIAYRVTKEYSDGSSTEEAVQYTLTDSFIENNVRYYNFSTEEGDSFFYIVETETGTIYQSKTEDYGEDDTLCVLQIPVENGGQYRLGTDTYTYKDIGGSRSIMGLTVQNVAEIEVNKGGSTGEDIVYSWSREYFLLEYKETFGSSAYLSSYEQKLTSFILPGTKKAD
jgi:hypothetical protein